jgi:hypothetical protein
MKILLLLIGLISLFQAGISISEEELEHLDYGVDIVSHNLKAI